MIHYLRAWAARNRSARDRFLAIARQAKDILAASEAEWQRLAPRIGTADRNILAIYRQRYRDAIPRRAVADEEADARAFVQNPCRDRRRRPGWSRAGA
jgi:NitT/TauT family transport system substrate-binding protein